jgi:hypothetical protein
MEEIPFHNPSHSICFAAAFVAFRSFTNGVIPNANVASGGLNGHFNVLPNSNWTSIVCLKTGFARKRLTVTVTNCRNFALMMYNKDIIA